MRYFNTVLFTVAMVFAITFGWSLGSATGWWGAIQYILHGSAVGWVIMTGLCLSILRLSVRWWPVRAWLKVTMTVLPTAWMALALVLRGEWSIIAMIAVSTAILVFLATPGSRRSRTSAPGAWRRVLKSLFVEPDPGAEPDATTTI